MGSGRWRKGLRVEGDRAELNESTLCAYCVILNKLGCAETGRGHWVVWISCGRPLWFSLLHSLLLLQQSTHVWGQQCVRVACVCACTSDPALT